MYAQDENIHIYHISVISYSENVSFEMFNMIPKRKIALV